MQFCYHWDKHCVFSVNPFLLWWLREYIYLICLIIVIKSEVWTITHYIGLGHETMLYTVCLSIFFLLTQWSMVISHFHFFQCTHPSIISLEWARSGVTNVFSLFPKSPRSGWLYVFSLFPPRPPPRPLRPPPQQLLLLTSKPFKLHLRYLGQRISRCQCVSDSVGTSGICRYHRSLAVQ